MPAVSSSSFNAVLEELARLRASDRALLSDQCPGPAEYLAWVPDPRNRRIPVAARQHGRGHGRQEHRTLKAAAVAAGLDFPHATQALCLTRQVRPLDGGRWRTVTIYAITSLDAHQATPAQLAAWIRGHRQIEALHHVRDVSYGEDASQIRAGSGPQAMATLRNLAISILKTAGYTSIAAAGRHHARDATRTLETLGLDPA